jgi:hypothetical protein
VGVSWDRKYGRRHYYYRARKVGGRCVKVYVGAGPVADLAAALDAAEREGRRRRREAWRAEVAALAAADRALADLAAVVGLVYRATLVLAGYHAHHGDWRRRSAMPRTAEKAAERESQQGCRGRKKAPKPPRAAAETDELGEGGRAAPDYRQLFRELVERANRGEELALTRLRQFLDLNPSIWERAGDLTAAAEAAWVGLVAGPDRLVAESVRRRLVQLRADLKGAQATPIECLLADQAALAWLAARHAEIEAAGPAGGSPQQAALRLRRAESAQKRLVGALRALATLRALTPHGRVPAGRPQLFDPRRERAGPRGSRA